MDILSKSNLRIIIRTFAGLEETLASEVLKLGGRNIKELTRAVQCEGDLGFVYKANFSLRTAINILVPIYEFSVSNDVELYNNLREFDWDEIQNVDQTFVINPIVGGKSVFNHSLFLAQRTKDALVDFFNNKYKSRPSVSKNNPDILYTIHADDDKFTLSLDSSGTILFKRGYRQLAGEAPLNEVLAAGLVQISGWNSPRPLYNPMCGSGSIGIEAALFAANIPPGVFRESFGFQKWKNYDEDLFNLITGKLLDKINENYVKVLCTDISSSSVELTAENVFAAKVEDLVSCQKEDFFQSKATDGVGTVIINPPYNERIELEDDIAFYKRIGDTLKHNYSGCTAWVLTANHEAAKFIGLRPSRKISLFNGQLECKFLRFDLYDGSKRKLSVY